MLRVGLTGSIGVGTSFVASVFAELGCHVIDADDTAREVVAPGTDGLAEVVKHFGPEYLQADGSLNRERLGALVFADQNKRELLNAILHPRIFQRQDQIIENWEVADPNGIAMVDAALMIESGGYRRFDKLIVVHCRPEVQLERLMLRNKLTRDEAQRRIDSQMPQSEKQRYADYLIDSSDGFEPTRVRTKQVYEQLVELQHKHR